MLGIGIVVMKLDHSNNMYVSSSNHVYPSPDFLTKNPLHLLKSGAHYDPLHPITSLNSNSSPDISLNRIVSDEEPELEDEIGGSGDSSSSQINSTDNSVDKSVDQDGKFEAASLNCTKEIT